MTRAELVGALLFVGLGGGALLMAWDYGAWAWSRGDEETRRVNGDAVILAAAMPFPNLDQTLARAAETAHVERAGAFALTPASFEVAGTSTRGLLKLQTFDERLVAHVRLDPDAVPRPNQPGYPPELTFGKDLAAGLGVTAGGTVSVLVLAPESVARTAVTCRVAAVVDWGFSNFDEQLVLGDLSHLEAFGLRPVGIELLIDPPRRRGAIADELLLRLGPPYQVFSLEELVKPLPVP